tara:strand:+ start:9 stop:380 length:372 start_codon:yes stop_codon:yes gene_type:complete
MKLELKSILHDAWTSDCGNCYQAEVYLNSRPFAHLQNDGTGCETDIKPHHLFEGTRHHWKYWRDAINKHLLLLSEDTVLDSSYGWDDPLLNWSDSVLKRQHPWVTNEVDPRAEEDFRLFMARQ